jgi:hypothetical protein
MKAMISVLTLLALVSCSSKSQQRELEAKASESKVQDGKALGNKIHDLIHSSKTLTDAQKSELELIMNANKQKADELTEKSFQFRGVLVKSLLSGNYNKKEVSLLKKDIEKIEKAKLKNTFDTIDKVIGIVAKHEEKEKIYGHLIMIDSKR